MNQADPTVSVAQTVVDHGTGAEVVVESTQSTARYQLTSGGAPVGAAVQGNGETIVLPTGPLSEDTTFVIRATKVNNNDIYADLQQHAAISVRPNTQLVVSADDAVVDSNGRTEIRIQASQSGVRYQLTVDGRPLGAAAIGNGDTIALSTGSLKADTIFVVRATNVNNTDIAVDLAQHVQVNVRPDDGGDDLEAHLAEVRRLVALGEFSQAITLLDMLLQECPSDVRLRSELERIHRAEQEVEILAAEALAWAQHYLCEYRYEDAIREAERGLERGYPRQQFQALLDKARVDLARLESLLETFNRRLAAGDYDQAGSTLDEIRRLASDWPAHFGART